MHRVALNFELKEGLPEWIELIPAGLVSGRDGRQWVNDLPQEVIDAAAAQQAVLPIDYEHSSQLKAPHGEESPAAGWIEALELRDGAIWGKVSWTPRGEAVVMNREYRYISPVFDYEKETKRIKKLVSIGLVNKPNLYLSALNREEEQPQEEGALPMKNLFAKLGLPETATEDQALNALAKMQGDLATALNRAETPSLDRFVPRADYDVTLARATNAEKTITDQAAAALETAICFEVDAALKLGKITPATKDYYTAMCRQTDGLSLFKTFVTAAPIVAAASDLDGKQIPDTATALNAEEKSICANLGISMEEYRKANPA